MTMSYDTESRRTLAQTPDEAPGSSQIEIENTSLSVPIRNLSPRAPSIVPSPP